MQIGLSRALEAMAMAEMPLEKLVCLPALSIRTAGDKPVTSVCRKLLAITVIVFVCAPIAFADELGATATRGDQEEGYRLDPDELLSKVSSDLDKLTDDAKAKPRNITAAKALSTKPPSPAQPIAIAASEPKYPSARFKLKPLPEEPILDHLANSSLDMGTFHSGNLVPFASLKPIQLEANYSEPLTLKDALQYALLNSLAIKISHQSWSYQRYQLWGTMAAAVPLPNFATSYNLTSSEINATQTSYSRVFQVGLTYPVFQGGSAVFGALAQYYRDKGWHQAYYASINDALLDVYQKYMNLLLQHTLLEIRAKSVEVSQAQLKLNNTLYLAGTGTQFAIMQSRTQLASDRQALMQEEVAVRQAALQLSFALNAPMAVNFVPTDERIQEVAIIDKSLPIGKLLGICLGHRPELRQYEMFRLSAQRNIQVAASSLYPRASFFTNYTFSDTNVDAIDPMPAAGGAGGVAGAGVFGGTFNTYQAGFNLNWTLTNLGLTSAINIVSAKALARQALMQANQELLLVTEQVRTDYTTVLSAREQIDNAAYGVGSAKEALRLAILRLSAGTGTNLEAIEAERDYINALTQQAQAIIGSNQAQAQLLHDMGVISIDSLTAGYDANSPSDQKNDKG
jgi:outer membrane protein TolC